MEAANRTRNQHFISQAEQRLNAIDPATATGIYEFEVEDRDMPKLGLPEPRSIKSSLACFDLFSFDVVEKLRHNLEDRFSEYERHITDRSRSLIDKLNQVPPDNNLKAEVVDLFAAKLLNFLRNPHSVQKAVNTIGVAADYVPDDPELREGYERVREGSKPHREEVCSRFGITPELYERWLAALFMVLMPTPVEGGCLFVKIVKDLFEKQHTFVQVYLYSEADGRNVCLLSDRGFNMPVGRDNNPLDVLVFEFNLASRAFARFAFVDPLNHPIGQQHPDRAEHLRGQVKVIPVREDHDALVKYNQLTVYQCGRTVFAAHPSPWLQK